MQGSKSSGLAALNISMIITILVFLLILSILVLIHELGHFLVAKKFGIKVEEFGFGLPPRAFGIKRGETIYSINWLPIGGFVKLYGEDEAGGGKRAFFARPVWQRGLVIIAGVAMNFILATLLVSFLFTQGVAIPTGEVKIGQVVADSPAAAAKLQTDDIITAIDGKIVRRISEVQKLIFPKLEQDVKLTIKRGDSVQEIIIKTKKEIVEGKEVGLIGVGLSDMSFKKFPIWEAPIVGTIEAARLSWLTVVGLGNMVWSWLILGQVPQDVAGPVGVAQITGQAVSVGPLAVVFFTGILSLNLAVLNILPIPALDGGRFFFILIEAVTRRRVNPNFERYAHTIGMMILLALIALITFRDIGRLLSGQPILPTP